MFKGYKTYIVAGVAVLSAVASYFTGDSTLPEVAQLVLTAIMGATIRNAIPK